MSFDYTKDWKRPVIRIGRFTLILAILSSCFPALYLAFVHGIVPDMGTLFKAWVMVASMFGMLYFIEPVSYFSVLGLSGTYLGFLSGNNGNMRVPCAMMGLEVTNSQPGTPRADIVSTLAIIGSIICNLVLLTIMAFVGVQALALMPPAMVQAFQMFTVPAVYGAILVQSGMKQPRLVPFGMAIPFALMYVGIPAYLVTLLTVFAMIGIGRLFYNHDKAKEMAQ